MKHATLSKVTLHKGGRTAVLLGLAHFAPPGFYRKVREEIDAAHAAGYRVFREKTYKKYRLWATRRERMLIRFLKAVREDLHERIPSFVDQSDALRYGRHRIADMPMDEVAALFEELGVRFDLPWEQFFEATKVFLEMAEADEVLLFRRDEIIVSQILKKCRKGSFLALYGQAHLYGMQRLLEEDGWDRPEWQIFDFFLVPD